MANHVIKMPDIGEGIVEVELVAWRVKPGESVQEDQILADVMTDKATVEIPSPVAGRVQSLGCEAGTVMRVGSALITIETEAVVGRAQSAPSAAAATTSAAKPAPIAASASLPRPQTWPDHVPAAPAASRPIASPSVRRQAWELGIDLAKVKPSGTAGRIMHADLEAYAASHLAGPSASLPQPQAVTPPVRARAIGSEASEDVPIIGLRRKIAQKMQESKRRIPHFSYIEEIDVTELEALRHSLNTMHGAARGRLTLLPLLVLAIVRAVRAFPQVNARLDDEAGVLTRYEAVHLGIATQTPSGLMVPVLRHAQDLDPWAAAAEIRRLAEVARAGKATRDELSGSTLTLSSLGPLGGIVSTPVINYPEVAIVGVNRIVERPVIRAGQVVARLTMNLSSSFDHRVVDGQVAAEFIQAVRGMLESPALLFVE